ncbi:TonB family protein [bacterium]|nr:TonB family protein [bacterium]
MNTSTVGFKVPYADLHKKSPRIYFLSLAVSCIVTFVLLTVPFPEHKVSEERIDTPPVIVLIKDIPKTRHTVSSPAPSKPFVTSGMPMEADEILPDNVTIEDTKLNLDSYPDGPPVKFVPISGADEEEKNVKHFPVLELPVRIADVKPEYPIDPFTGQPVREEGSVLVEVLVTKEGIVDSVKVISGPGIFHKSAIEAAKATKFIPAKKDDKPMEYWVIIPYRFKIEE